VVVDDSIIEEEEDLLEESAIVDCVNGHLWSRNCF